LVHFFPSGEISPNLVTGPESLEEALFVQKLADAEIRKKLCKILPSRSDESSSDEIFCWQKMKMTFFSPPSRIQTIKNASFHSPPTPSDSKKICYFFFFRVTRFGEFSSIGDCLHFGQFSENYRSRPIVVLNFTTVNVMHSFCQKWIGLHLGTFFHKRIWSQSYDRELQRQRCKNLQRC
jgi:hypothetical protein